ncbi:MAG: thioesterase family protein [Acidobacteriota bacterium]
MPRQPPSRRQDYRVFHPLQTRWADSDRYGHMNNVVHYALFDTAINAWLIERGLLHLGANQPSADAPHQIGLVVETGCRYHAEMAFPDRVTAGLRLGRLGTSSVRYEIGLFRNDADVAAADGHFVHVYVDRATRRPEPLAPAFRQALEELRVESPGPG